MRPYLQPASEGTFYAHLFVGWSVLTMNVVPDSEFFHSSPSLTFSAPAPQPELALLGLLVDELSNGMFVVNAQGRILHANLAARRVLVGGVMMKEEWG
jgi:PAS domain-containing protein